MLDEDESRVKNYLDEFKDDAENNDNKTNGINERDTVGIEIYDDLHEITHIIYSVNDEEYNEEYDELIDNLNKSNMIEHKLWVIIFFHVPKFGYLISC